MPKSVHERIEFEDNLIEEQQRKNLKGRSKTQSAVFSKGSTDWLPPQLVQTRSVVGGEQWSD